MPISLGEFSPTFKTTAVEDDNTAGIIVIIKLELALGLYTLTIPLCEASITKNVPQEKPYFVYPILEENVKVCKEYVSVKTKSLC